MIYHQWKYPIDIPDRFMNTETKMLDDIFFTECKNEIYSHVLKCIKIKPWKIEHKWWYPWVAVPYAVLHNINDHYRFYEDFGINEIDFQRSYWEKFISWAKDNILHPWKSHFLGNEIVIAFASLRDAETFEVCKRLGAFDIT